MVKNHKKNTNFQITHFLAGKCHTPDGAFSMLCNLKEEREAVLLHYECSQLKEQAKKIRAERLVNSKDEADILDGEADLLEIKNNHKTGLVLLEAAQDELEHINKCLVAIQPLRQYKDLPDLKAHEAAQQEEWKLELIHRAENYMLTSGSIPADHFVTMRMHPDFKQGILPRITEMTLVLKDPTKSLEFLLGEKDSFKLLIE